MKWVILLTLIVDKLVRQPSPVVRVSGGLLRGRLGQDGGFYEFLGVPYATTTPQTRFQAPLPGPKWDHVFEAIEENVRCPQRISTTTVIGQEDCLTLNIFVPVLAFTNGTPLPVMVFVHGGGFYDGSGLPAIYGAEYLVKHGVILVTINYRLNIQGFVCLGIEEAPGNAGLKDQVAAFRWVQKNIAEFGGNPDDVTIFGESAGAASVSYHLLSPMSKGLFHRAILQSGSSTASWANQYDSINMAYLLAKELGYNTRDPYELYQIFMNTSYQELIVTRVPRPEANIIMTELLFIPCVEKEIPGVEPFLTDFPYNVLKKGQYNKVPVIIGFNSHEGYLFVGKENDTTIANLDIRKAMPKNLYFPSDRDRIEAADRVKQFYFGDKAISKETLVELAHFEGDPYFKYPSLVETDLILQTSNEAVYNYEFRYDGYLNLGKFSVVFNSAPGATHADELFYMFNPRSIPTPQAIFEKNMIDKMTTLWTNFAKFGTPTPEATPLLPHLWHPTNASEPRVFVIDQEFTSKPMWSDAAMLMWRDIYDKYRSKLYYT